MRPAPGRELERRLKEDDRHAVESDCRPVAEILARVGDKWTVLIVMLLSNGPKRFNELRRLVGGISQRMLTSKQKMRCVLCSIASGQQMSFSVRRAAAVGHAAACARG